MTIRSFVFAAAIAAASTMHAQAVVVDFQTPDITSDQTFDSLGISTLTESGFSFTPNATNQAFLLDGQSGVAPGEQFLFMQNTTTEYAVTAAAPFSVQSIGLASLFSASSGTVLITGNLDGGGQVSETVNITDTFSIYVLPGTFTGLSSLVIDRQSTAFVGLDKITFNEASLSAVPLPGTLPLLLGALGIFAVARRRI